MQAGGNRARFFAPQAAKVLDMTGISDSSRDGNFTPSASSKESDALSSEFDTGSNTASSGATGSFSKQKLSHDELVPHRSASDSEATIVGQRTRMAETETGFSAKREGSGRLNVSGLIKHDTNFSKAAPQSANNKEVVENEELGTRSPRQYPSSKLISKSTAPSYSSSFPHFTAPSPTVPTGSSNMPPSNQLAQSFKMPSHHAPRSDISVEDASRINQTSHISHADTNNSHISSRLLTNSCDDSIKSLTTAFNRKHSGAPRNSTPRFPSPVSHHSNSSRSGRTRSPHAPAEDDLLSDNPGSSGQRSLKIESRKFAAEISNDGDFQEIIYQGSEQYNGGSVQEQQRHRESHRKRGEKRISESEVDDGYVPLGKRARIGMYDEQSLNHGSNSSIPSSPDPEPRDNEPFKEAVSQERSGLTRQDAQLKVFSGQDVDEYVANHMDRYEAAKKRWTECSTEEWEKGADVLVDRFSKVLDFVKEHMKRRVALYASLHTKIDKHQKERGETAEMLQRAKSKLVAQTGIVVEEGKL